MYYAHSREDGQFQLLEDHLVETARRAGEFAQSFEADAWGHAIGLFHDYGKSSANVQERITADGKRADHSTAGAQAICRYAGLVGAYCVAGHHGRLPDGGSKAASHPMDPTLHGRLKRNMVGRNAPAEELNIPLPEPLNALPFPIPSDDALSMALLIRMLTSCLIDADRLDTEQYGKYGELNRGEYDDISTLAKRLREAMREFKDDGRPITQKRAEILGQCRSAAEHEQGIYTLTVPTGGGKTLSSLSFALEHAKKHGLRRVIYIIPYLNIIEQTADVFRGMLGEDQVIEHHSNVQTVRPGEEEEDYDAQGLRVQNVMENWDAPLIVTTSVQFLSSLFAASASKLRKIHRIADSVLVFDEAQMLPLPFLTPCVKTIAELVRHYGCTALLMSATQPALNDMFPKDLPIREIMDQPMALNRFFRRTTLRPIGEIEVSQLAEMLNGCDQALAIVNTRSAAGKLYHELCGDGRYHLSTLMYPNHRREVLNKIRYALKEGMPCRVVSTSLIEAGVDLDFPRVFREEAGLDSIIQAAGRCNREGKRLTEESEVLIFRRTGARTPASMMQSVNSLHYVQEKHDDLASLDAIRCYFEFLYRLRGDGLDQKRIIEMTGENRQDMAIPFRRIERDFQLIENDTETVIISIEAEAEDLVQKLRDGVKSRALYRALGAFSVSIYPAHFQALQAAGAIEIIEDTAVLRDPGYYDESTGLRLDIESGLGIYM